MRQLISALLLLFGFSFSACKTDFEVIAPYKEIPVVYGLLDISDSIQWVKINKSFLGEGNALIMAQQPDSINYPDILDVELEEYFANNYLRKIILQRDSSLLKEEGIFATSPNILYRIAPGGKIFGKNTYKLVIHNRQNDSVVTSTTSVVDSFSIITPIASPLIEINWISPFPYVVKWSASPEGAVYQLIIRFHYTEEPVSNPGTFTEKEINWVFPETEIAQNAQSSDISQSMEGEFFYKFVAGSIQADNTVRRLAGTLDFIVTCGGREFHTYIQVNKPPTGINQHLPQYTNINGGIGIFSSRIVQEVKDKKMNQQSEDSLKFGSITGHLGFY